ncbi:glycosyltransferase family A protein [Cryobacterium sp. Y11]|uniref:glycosyltransferase family 2 protein n=1 Tax=Cryobacterium sp. Y11 TaxID=2045016 RepID=UPI000CE3C868|nr:glycosyltransferase family A protein [Cryobacterium sp. Y11]
MDIQELTLSDFPFSNGAFDKLTAVTVHTEVFSSSLLAEAAFIVPVHNQASAISANLDSIRQHSMLDHEIVVIIDGCTDGTLAVIFNWLAACKAAPGRTVRVTVVDIPTGVFETMSDAIGIHLSMARAIIEVQADMSITHPGFDSELTRALEMNPEIFALSGRGAHSFSRVSPLLPRPKIVSRIAFRVARKITRILHARALAYAPSAMQFAFSDEIGRVGDLIDLPTRRQETKRIYVLGTVMRGPLAFSRERYSALGGLDTARFFLGNDDHDLVSRAWCQLRLKSGYLPISFLSPLESGSTRAIKSAKEQARFEELTRHYQDAQRTSVLFNQIDIRAPKKQVIRVPKDNSPVRVEFAG